MAVATTLVTSGSDTTDQTVYTFSYSVAANRPLFLFVVGNGSVASLDTVTGPGLTPVRMFDNSLGTARHLSVWRAMATAPASGTMTLTFASARTGAMWSLVECSGADTSGSNGSGAVAATADAESETGQTSGTVSGLPATAGNATVAAFLRGQWDTPGFTPGTGYTELSDDQMTGPTCALATEWRADAATTATGSWPTSRVWAAYAVEVKAAAGGAATTGTLSAATILATAALVGTVAGPVFTGTLAGTTPTPTASISGTVAGPTYTGTLTASVPVATGSLAGNVTAPAGGGTLAATLPLVIGSIAGTVTAPTWTATLAASVPNVTASITGTVAAPTFTGTLAGVLPRATAALAGTVTTPGPVVERDVTLVRRLPQAITARTLPPPITVRRLP